MRIVREQMLCIISENWTGGGALLESPDVAAQLTQMFMDVGMVHFASIALLPPRPGLPHGSRPSLMLEITADEGVRPTDLLAALAHHPDGALWHLYGALYPVVTHVAAKTREEWLLAHLLHDLSVCDGGFVGPRDRSVQQVRQEWEFRMKIRQEASRTPSDQKTDRRTFAAALAKWSLGERRHWATSTAPRSFWRAHGGRTKGGLFIGLVALTALAILVVKWLAQGLGWIWDACCQSLPPVVYESVAYPLHKVSDICDYLFCAGERLGLVAFFGAVGLAIYWLVFALLRSAIRPWNAWFAAVGRELDRPSDAPSTRVTTWFCWLVLGVVLLELSAVFAYIVAGSTPVLNAWTWLKEGSNPWLKAGGFFYSAIFFVLLAVLLVGLRTAKDSIPTSDDGPLRRALKTWRRKFLHPSEADTQRAQQVHEMVERCEARLVAGTAHMVSLTELRRPYFWSAFWTRLSLRFVTAYGYIFFTEGRLGDAPGIQFSHWHLIDKGRRLLFCANFDGTFGGYLDDFIKGASTGTTLFWRWTQLLPRGPALAGHPSVDMPRDFAPTRLLVFRGVRCEQKFKAFARDSMLPHQFRFVASELSLDQKNRATALRDAVCGERTDAKDDLIMRAIE